MPLRGEKSHCGVGGLIAPSKRPGQSRFHPHRASTYSTTCDRTTTVDTGTIVGMDTGTFVGVVGAVIGVIGIYFGIDGKHSARQTKAQLDALQGGQATEQVTLEVLKAAVDRLVLTTIEANPGVTKELVVELAGTSMLGTAGTGVIEVERGRPHEKRREPEQTDVREEDTKALADAITRLPEAEKLLVTLNYYEDLSEEEIGEVLNLPLERVQALERVAFRHLIDHLGPTFGSDTVE